MSLSADRLQKSSERFVEGSYASREDYLIFLMTQATYDWAAEFTAGRDTLDFGSGSGWGAARLASTARRVVGVDVDADAVAYARSRYEAPNLAFELLTNGLAYQQEFDAVVSIQVLEHVPDPDAYLASANRALRQGGVILLATPNRATRLYRFQKPWNPWHLNEWDRAGLYGLVARHFHDPEIFDMTGDVDWEVARTTRLKRLALPLTLPFIPAPIRRRGLTALSAARKRRGTWTGTASLSIEIVPHGSPSVNLLVRARKR